MTSDTEAIAEEAPATSPAGADLAVPAACNTASLYLRVSAVFLALGLIDLVVLAVKRVSPGFLDGIAALSYGRVVPAMTTLLLHGWLTIGLLGALIYVTARVADNDIEDANLLRGALGLLAVAALGGAVAVLFGFTEGRRYLESPLVLDLLYLVAVSVVGRSVVRTARGSSANSPVLWYSAAAVTCLPLVHIAGNWPGLSGFTGQIQTSFYRSSLVGLFMVPAAVALIYYASARLSGRPHFPGTRLSTLGIWSLGLTWAMTGPAELTFGAAGDWLETIGVIFSIVLFLPLVVIATDLTHAMRGAWDNVVDRTSLRYVMSALAMLGVFALFNLVQSLRASSAVVGFTDWVAALEVILLLGPFTLALIAFMRTEAHALFGGSAGSGLAGYRVGLAGMAVTLGAMAVAGLQTGFTWAGAANSAEFNNFGEGWVSTTGPLEGNYVVQLVGLALLAIGTVWGVVAAMARRPEELVADRIEPAVTEDDLVLAEVPSIRKVRRYAVGFFALAALMVFLLPALETEQPTLIAEGLRTFEPGEVGATGRAIYIQEGCAYCHTQQVRPIITDVGLGPVSVLGDYANETPVLIGVQRYGPDLMHIALRVDSDSLASTLGAHAPSYDYLSQDDVAALIAYLNPEE